MERIRSARVMLVTAGAGMGVDSGLPDFRGNQGFWKAYPPFAKLGLGFMDMANPAWFDRDPTLAWGFYGHRLNLYRKTSPHRGFSILKRWADERMETAFVFTSNVDGQFQKAGFDPLSIEECHGSIHHLQCVNACRGIWAADGVEVRVDASTMRAREPLPSCPQCGGLARPNILMFGDWGWDGRRSEAQAARFSAWSEQSSGRPLVVVELGAGTAVPTVRYASELAARRSRGTLIRINVRESAGPSGCVGLAMGALEALECLDSGL